MSPNSLILPPVSQIGLIVKDVAKTASHYEATFGIGPFSIVDNVRLDGVILRGRPVPTTIKVAFAQFGPLQIELIQPLEGENIYTEFLASRGEGLHHLGFEVDDLEGMLAAFKEKGIEPVFWLNLGFTAFAYLNTDAIGGATFELLWSEKRGGKSRG
jgi:methylmalonyl-CoA/ethylmalonyl-CoA epimerase